MLVQPRYRSSYSFEDAKTKLREEINDDPRVKAERFPDQDFYAVHPRRLGRPLHHSDVLRLLRRLLPDLYVTDTQVGTVGLYVPHNRGKDLRFLGGCPLGWMPEWSMMLTDERGVAVEERRGWRTVLAKLIKQGVVEERDANRVFGRPIDEGPSKKWHLQCRKFRS